MYTQKTPYLSISYDIIIYSFLYIGTKRPAEESAEAPTPKAARSELMNPTQTFEKGLVPDDSAINLTGEKYKELMTKLEEAKASEKRLAEMEEENARLRKESGVFEYAKKDIVEKEQKTIDDVGNYIKELDERVLDTPEGKPYKNAFDFLQKQILPAKHNPDFLISPAFQEKDKNFLLTMQAASLDADFRVEEAKKESEDLKTKLDEALKTIEDLRQETIQKGAKIDFLQRGVRSSAYQSGVHTTPSPVMANASMDSSSMFSDYRRTTSHVASTPTPTHKTSTNAPRGGLFATPAPKAKESPSPSPRAETPTPTPPRNDSSVPSKGAMGSYHFKSSVDAFTKGFGMDPRFAEALKMRQTGQLKMLTANASLDREGEDSWDEHSQLELLKNSSKDDALPQDTSRWEGMLGERVRFPTLF